MAPKLTSAAGRQLLQRRGGALPGLAALSAHEPADKVVYECCGGPLQLS